MLEEVNVLVQFGSLSLSSYGLCMACAALVGVLLTLCLHRKQLSTAISVCLCSVTGAVLGGHLVWCLLSIARLPDYMSGYGLIWQLWLGGYSLIGTVLGILAALAIYGLASHQAVLPLLDMVIPGGMATLCLGRLAEYFSSQGLGEYIEEEAFMRFPCGVAIIYEDGYPEWRVPVFFYEAIAALILLVIALVLIRRIKQPGRLTGTIMTLLCASQIVLEQLRADDFLRFGFVRINQVAAILCMLIILLVRIRMQVQRHGWRTTSVLRLVLLPLTALVVIFIEFAFEKGWVIPYLCITIMVTACVGVCALVDRGVKIHCCHKGKSIALYLLALAEIAVCVWAVWAVNQDFEWENTMLLGMMALAMAGGAAAVLCGDKCCKE